MKMRIFRFLDPHENRMPKDTSRSVHVTQHRQVPLVNPDVFVSNNPAIQRLFADLNPANSANIRQMSKERLQRMVDNTNRKIANSVLFKNIHFEVHEESGRTFAVVRNSRTGQILRQFPSNYMLEMSARVQKAAGHLTDIEA